MQQGLRGDHHAWWVPHLYLHILRIEHCVKCCLVSVRCFPSYLQVHDEYVPVPLKHCPLSFRICLVYRQSFLLAGEIQQYLPPIVSGWGRGNHFLHPLHCVEGIVRCRESFLTNVLNQTIPARPGTFLLFARVSVKGVRQKRTGRGNCLLPV